MRLFSTYIKAINPNTGELCTFCGPNIEGPSAQWVRDYCDNSGIGWGYLFVGDEIAEIIPCKKGTIEPDWENKTDYQLASKN